jgi:hypothetical protein
MNTDRANVVDARLLQRVRSEYAEMPGLQLTVQQASRLWNTDLSTSTAILDALVELRFLRMSGSRYLIADSGRRCA